MKKILILLSLFVLVIFALSSVMAATLTIRPNNNGYYSQWNKINCNSTAGYTCVNEVVFNGNNYISTTGYNKEIYNFQDISLTSERITSLTLFYYAKRQSTTNYRINSLFRKNGVDVIGGYSSLYYATSWLKGNQKFVNNPSTGASWTVSDINNLEAGFAGSSGSYPGGQIAQVYATVEYEPIGSKPDLIVDYFYLSSYSGGASNSSNGTIDNSTLLGTVSFSVKNIGTGTADPSKVSISGINNYEKNVSLIAPGQSAWFFVSYPCTTPHNVIITADSTNLLQEINESNNVKVGLQNC